MFGNFVIPPTLLQLSLLKYLLIITLFLHLSFIGMVVSGFIFSLLYSCIAKARNSKRYEWFAKTLIDICSFNIITSIIFGIIPLFIIAYLLSCLFFETSFALDLFLQNILIFVILGFFFLHIYRQSFQIRDKSFELHIGAGLLGIILLLGGYFFFISTMNLTIDPENWVFIKKPHQLLYGWSVVWRYLEFLIISCALTGMGILISLFIRDGGAKSNELTEPYKKMVKKFGLVVPFVCAFLLPVIKFFEAVTVANISLSVTFFYYSYLLLIILTIICFLIKPMWEKSTLKYCIPVLVLFLAVWLVSIVNNHRGIETANSEHLRILTGKAEAAKKDSDNKQSKNNVSDLEELTTLGNY